MKIAKTIRFALLGAAALGTAAAAALAPVEAFAIELKLAHFTSPRHPMDRFFMRPWSEELAKMSNGELTVRIFPAGELGKGPQQQFKRAVDGAADITFGLQGYTAPLFPRTTLVEMPGVGDNAVESTLALWRAFHGHIEQEYSQVKVLALWTGEIPVLMTKDKPVRSIDDLAGMKIRTPSRAQASLIEALGATPVPMPVTQVYQSLDTGVVDALLIPPSTIRSFKLNEVAKFYTTGLPFGRSPFFLVMNQKSWDSLSPDERALINKTTGPDWSTEAAAVYERAGAGALKSVQESPDHEVIALPPEEVEKGRALLLAKRAEIIANLEEDGIPASAIMTLMGAIGS